MSKDASLDYVGQELAKETVNHPEHYLQGYIETIYAIAQTLGPEGFKAFCMGNWMKYRERAAHKGKAEDLKKAEVYLGWAVNGLPFPKLIKTKAVQDEITDAANYLQVNHKKFRIGDWIRNKNRRDLENKPIHYKVMQLTASGYLIGDGVFVSYDCEDIWELAR